MIEAVQYWAGWIALGSFALTVGGFFLAACVIASMPADHFLHRDPAHRKTLTIPRLIWIVARNIIGSIILLAGIFMWFVPGPGTLAILLGISIIDLPGKRTLLERGLRFKSVRKTLNWIRRKCDKPAFQFPKRAD